MLRILSTLLAGLLAVYGCVPDDYEYGEAPVHFVNVTPRSGESISANTTLTLIFDGVPINLTSSAGKVTVDGRTAKIDGPFTPGPLEILVAWTDETVRLTYMIVEDVIEE
ncbi:hypothetical protein F4Y59_15225 [Candidatus Poribacteria bacterium]|nr:hypothetical protein [Candidatus Poribacteria bacterium]MXY29500.1 hypothetical protein [Candidatus Poribacteria bacterium]MYK20591.1 hypothetical protein [Candidatus Poribacteria bacterium]